VVKDADDLTEGQMAGFARWARGVFKTGPREQYSSRPVTPGGLDEGLTSRAADAEAALLNRQSRPRGY
jgi:hypothetical protein